MSLILKLHLDIFNATYNTVTKQELKFHYSNLFSYSLSTHRVFRETRKGTSVQFEEYLCSHV